MDPTSLSAAAGVVYLSKDAVARLLGPTSEYLGGELKELVERCQINLATVFKKAQRKCGDTLNEPGVVNPRVLKHVYDEARFSEDDLAQEYFAGVLASSRTDDGKDDMGVYYSQIVESLSTFQIRMHYFFYYLIWLHAEANPVTLYEYTGRQGISIVIPASVYEETFTVHNNQKEMGLIAHALAGLSRMDLIESNYQFSSSESLKNEGIIVNEQAFVISPALTGIELFIWAHGKGSHGLETFLSSDLVGSPELQVGNLDRVKPKRLCENK